MRLPELRKQITEYMQQGLIMLDVQASAQECQKRIEAMGYKWDSERLLWRAPEKKEFLRLRCSALCGVATRHVSDVAGQHGLGGSPLPSSDGNKAGETKTRGSTARPEDQRGMK